MRALEGGAPSPLTPNQESASMSEQQNVTPVIVTTERRGVFHGNLKSYDEAKRVAELTDVCMVIKFGTTEGLFQLAATGPTSRSKLSLRAPALKIELCTAIIHVAPVAEEAWKSTKR